MVCLLVTLRCYAKTAELIRMPFLWLTHVGHRNHVLDGGQNPPIGRDNVWELFSPLKSIGSLRCSLHSKSDHLVVSLAFSERDHPVLISGTNCDAAFLKHSLSTCFLTVSLS